MYTLTNPLKIAVFFSGGASAIKYLQKHDPNFGKTYTIVAGISDTPDASGIAYVRDELGIETKVFNLREFYREHKVPMTNLAVRDAYYEKIVAVLLPLQPDLIMLSGFMAIITPALLMPFAHRIINVHPADLRITELCGEHRHRPRYAGAHAVEKALASGEQRLRSTIHFVITDVDCGRIICVSDPYPVDKNKSAHEHQEAMKDACDGPAYRTALEKICSGEVKLGATKYV